MCVMTFSRRCWSQVLLRNRFRVLSWVRWQRRRCCPRDKQDSSSWRTPRTQFVASICGDRSKLKHTPNIYRKQSTRLAAICMASCCFALRREIHFIFIVWNFKRYVQTLTQSSQFSYFSYSFNRCTNLHKCLFPPHTMDVFSSLFETIHRSRSFLFFFLGSSDVLTRALSRWISCQVVDSVTRNR